MSFARRLSDGDFPVALEITPPKHALPKVLLRRATLLGDAADAVNVIQRPGRQSSLDASIALRKAGLDPVWHMVTRGRSREAIAADLRIAADAGINQVLCIRGDHHGKDRPDTPTIREAVQMACAALPGALVGATLNQYVSDGEAVLRNLLPKLKAGATVVQTQPVFEPATLQPFVDRMKEADPSARVIAMVVPILSGAAADGLGRRLGIELPGRFCRSAESGPRAAWEVFAEALAACRQCGFVDGVAIMTTEMDPSPETGAQIVHGLRLAGIGVPGGRPA